jgi:hypothetical protein
LSFRPIASSEEPSGLEPPGPGAPAWTTRAWLNAAEPLTLAALRGRAFGALDDMSVAAAIAALLHEDSATA